MIFRILCHASPGDLGPFRILRSTTCGTLFQLARHFAPHDCRVAGSIAENGVRMSSFFYGLVAHIGKGRRREQPCFSGGFRMNQDHSACGAVCRYEVCNFILSRVIADEYVEAAHQLVHLRSLSQRVNQGLSSAQSCLEAGHRCQVFYGRGNGEVICLGNRNTRHP